MRSPLQLNAQPKVPVARLSVLHCRVKARPDARVALRVREDGKFKIVQISDTHMVTGPRICKDTIDAQGNILQRARLIHLRWTSLVRSWMLRNQTSWFCLEISCTTISLTANLPFSKWLLLLLSVQSHSQSSLAIMIVRESIYYHVSISFHKVAIHRAGDRQLTRKNGVDYSAP